MTLKDDLVAIEEKFWSGGHEHYRKALDDDCLRGQDQPYRALVSSGYVKRGSTWKMMFHQQTPLSD